MSIPLKDDRQRIAELEARIQYLQQQLSEYQQSYGHQTVQEGHEAIARQENTDITESNLEHFLRLALDNIPQVIFWKNRQSVYLGCNKYLARIAGLNSPEEIIGKTDWDLPWKPEEIEFFLECDRRVMGSDTAELGIIESIHQADGSRHWLETNKIPLHDARGNVIGILGTVTDITQRTEAELELQKLNEELEQRIEERTRELRSSEARLQRLAANLPGLIFQFRWETDGTRSFPYVSEGCRDIYELKPENFLQAFTLIHPDDRDSLDQDIQDSARSLRGFHNEHRIITPSGLLKWVQVISRPERQENGAIVWDGLIIEISDRKQAERELQEQKQLLRSIYDGVAHPIFVVDVLENGSYRYVSYNQAAEEVTGLKTEAIAGKALEEIFTPEQAAAIRQDFDRAVMAGASYSYEECRDFAKGKIWFFTTINPLKDTAGRIYRLVGTALDITHRKQVEERLRQQEAQYRQIFEIITDALGIMDLETGEFVEVNPAYPQMHGYPYEEFMALPLANHVHPDSLPLLYQFIEEIRAGHSFSCQAQNVHRNGQAIDIEVKGIPYPYSGKTHALAIVRDISQRVQLEAERQRQEQALRSIVEGTAAQTGEAFFRACVKSLAMFLEVRYVAIGEVRNNHSVQTLAFWKGEDFSENLEYNLAGTPCANILVGNHICCYPHSIQSLFPEDLLLSILEAQSYVGIPILNPQGHLLGLIAVIDTKPIEQDLKIQTSILEIFAARAGAEMERIQAERALQEKETLLQITLEAGKMGCWNWNCHTNQVIWSDGVEGILCLKPGSFGGTFEEYVALIHPDDRDRVLQVIEETLETQQEYNIQHRIVLPDGDIQWLRATGGIWRNDKGEVMGLLGSVLNDTQYKAAEIALIESTVQIHQQAQQEQLLNQIANQIRTSLDLDRILNTTVREIQGFLDVDRCHFAWYVPEAEEPYWDIIAEVQSPGLPSFVGKHQAANFGAISQQVLREQILRLDDFSIVADSALQEVLTALGNKSMLVLPVRAESGKFGIIACIHSQTVRPWSDREVEFLEAVVAQLAIALNQADILAQSQARARELEELLTQLQQTQTQLIQTEKMSSLGQLVAGVAHEINNPVSFIHGNISHAREYLDDLMHLLDLYQSYYPQSPPEIRQTIEAIDLEFIKEDLHKLFQSMQVGTDRIREIVKSLRTFSRLDEAEIKAVDLHEGIDSTLTILQTRLRSQDWRPEIQVIKDYAELPRIICYAGQLNQVFMNILSNAIDALEERDRDRLRCQMQEHPSTIIIQTRVVAQKIAIRITDNGPGMSETTKARLFDPFFTTKPVGKGTGLGLSISYQIITEKHQGHLWCNSQPGETTFIIELPIKG